VKVHLELCEIADRAMKMPGGGPALLFEQPVLRDGSRSPSIPVAINLFGSMRAWRWRSASSGSTTIGDRITRAAGPQGARWLPGQAVSCCRACSRSPSSRRA
jgi:4-hydroxy-3-polyprenylbenzoate decarboxylase